MTTFSFTPSFSSHLNQESFFWTLFWLSVPFSLPLCQEYKSCDQTNKDGCKWVAPGEGSLENKSMRNNPQLEPGMNWLLINSFPHLWIVMKGLMFVFLFLKYEYVNQKFSMILLLPCLGKQNQKKKAIFIPVVWTNPSFLQAAEQGLSHLLGENFNFWPRL